MVVTVAAVITAQDRRKYLPDAIRSAVTAGADEIVVVRNFSDPLDESIRLRCNDILVTDPEIGAKHVAGLAAARSDVVCFLDDDDLWEPGKVASVREWFSDPALVYADHFQTPVDTEDRPVVARHPEWAQRVFRPGPVDLLNDFHRFHEENWPGNCSSTCVRRSWTTEFAPWLQKAGWSADTFWLVAAAVSRRPTRFPPDRLTRLRLHDANMSQTRGSDPAQFRERHRVMCERFARGFGVMIEMAQTHGAAGTDLERFLVQRERIFRYWSDLESGRLTRRSSFRFLWQGPRWDHSYAIATMLSTASPDLARRMVYRSSVRRWSVA
jgi:glycosyltransferase involved in cell wall biosynthesis